MHGEDIPRRIDFDVACDHCGYNLRGLMEDDRCPECGERIPFVSPVSDEEMVEWRRASVASDAERIGATPDGYLLVLDAIRLAHNLRNPGCISLGVGTSRALRHVTASDICGAIAQIVREYFNDIAEARELLAEWGIRSSDDVARIFAGIVASGRIENAEGIRAADFAGLFTIDDLLR